MGPPDAQHAARRGIHFSEMQFQKFVRGPPTREIQSDVLRKAKKRGEGSSETLDRHFGHYSPDMRYDPDRDDSVSQTSTLPDQHHHDDDDDTTESPSPSTESDRLYPSRTPNLTRYPMDPSPPNGRQEASPRPSSQLAQCLLSLTAMADDTTDEDDIIFEQPSTSAPLWNTPPERLAEPHLDWPIVQFQAPPSRPQHRHPESSSSSPKNGRAMERWSSNSSSWNLSLLAKPKAMVTKVLVSGSSSSGSKPKRRNSERPSSNYSGVTLREIHNGASSSTAVLTYNRSGDAHGRHKWERDSLLSSSSPSVEEIGFEAYDRPGEMAHTLDEEDFPFSPIASSFVFGEHNNSVEFSQRGGGGGGRTGPNIPRAVGPVVQAEFASSSPPTFEIHADFQSEESMSTASEGSHYSCTYSPRGGSTSGSGGLQPELDWVPTGKSFHYNIKGPNRVEIVEVGGSDRSSVFNGYFEINQSGRFSIDLQRGPRLERHLSALYHIEKTPEVLLRIVEEAHSRSTRRRSNAAQYANCKCLRAPRKGLLGRCLTSDEVHRVAVANSFESRLRSRSLG